VTVKSARRIRPVEIVILSVALLLTAAAWVHCAPGASSPQASAPGAALAPTPLPEGEGPGVRAATVRVAAVQMTSRFADPAANRDKMEKLAREAAKGGAKIVVFPEAAVQGYVSPKFELWTDPKRRPGEGKSLEGFAEPADGESAERFGKLSGELKVYLVVPFIERAEIDGGVKYFNSLLLFGPDGKRLLHYRKLNPWPRAEATWAADGDRGLAFVDTEYGRLGLLICYDIHSVAARLAAEKVDTLLYAIAWVDLKPERWFGERLPDKAKTLGVNIVAANWTFPDDDRLVDRGYGYSRVIDRTGKVLAAAKAECGEEIVFAELPVAGR
jgi:predicted amidohydrolase